MRTVMLISMLALALACSACTKQDGPLERAGQKVDDAVDNVKDGQSPFHKKGAGEKAGEAVDDAVNNMKGK